MRNLIILPILTLSMILIACAASSEKKYDKTKFNLYEDSFISFHYPKQWKLKEVDTSEVKIKMYSIEEKAEESSFILTITIDTERHVSNMIEIQRNILDNYIPEAKAGRINEITIGNLDGLAFNYNFNKGLSYKGCYQSLECNNFSVGINYQYSLDEEKRVLSNSLKTIESINCK